MIVLDSHVWVWWVHGDERLTRTQAEVIEASEEWFEDALSYPGIRLLELTPEIAIESTQLPGDLHRDPADQMIVATAKVYGCPLVTSDGRLLEYPHVETIA